MRNPVTNHPILLVPLDKKLLQQLLDENNIMVWLWKQKLQSQWSLMAPSAFVALLETADNLHLGATLIVIKCNNSKIDKQAVECLLQKRTLVPT